MSNSKPQDYQDELDVYQAAWVLGKQRGNEKPLSKDQLAKLLDAGRLEWGWLNEEERGMVGKGRGEFGKHNKLSVKKKVGITRFVVDELFNLIERDFKDFLAKFGFEKMNELQKEETKEELFRYKYGSYRNLYQLELYKQLWSN